jgi:hypothetical protein
MQSIQFHSHIHIAMQPSSQTYHSYLFFFKPVDQLDNSLQKAREEKYIPSHLWGATAGKTGVQRAIADRVAGTQPGEESLQTQTVSTVGGGTVPKVDKIY